MSTRDPGRIDDVPGAGAGRTSSARDVDGRDKRALLERLLRDRLSPPAPEHPLSYNQRSIWFMHRLAPDSCAYNVPYVFRVPGPFDVEALRGAFRALIARHAILRTTYSAVEPVQCVRDTVEPDFVVIDASGWRDPELWDAIEDEAHRPFDLIRGPVLRIRVYTRGASPAFLVVTFHHIAYDLWSMMTMLHELGALYSSVNAAAPRALAPPRYQYQDFVHWQAKMLSAEGERLWEFWQEHLSGTLPTLQLPTDRERPAVQSYAGAVRRGEVPGALVSTLQSLARAERTTLFAVLLSAYQMLLHAWSGQADLLVGTPVAGRSRPEFEDLIGYFLNTLPLRSRLEGDSEYRAFLGRTRQTVHGALAHQDYPVELLAQRLRPTRSASHAAFFQTLFVLNRPHRVDQPEGARAARAVQFERVPLDLHISQFDVSLQIDQIGESLEAVWEYNTDLFDDSTIARWAGRFERLLEAIVEDPARRVSDLLRRAAGEESEPRRGRSDVAPRTAVEEVVAAVYCDVLGLDQVSVHDSLFDIGGDSFRAALVASRLATIAGPDITLKVVFECRTVERLAARVEQLLLDDRESGIPDPVPGPPTDPPSAG